MLFRDSILHRFLLAVFMVCLAIAVDCIKFDSYKDMEELVFDSAVWKSNKKQRLAMAKDLVKTNFKGIPKSEIVSKLGKPDVISSTGHCLSYDMVDGHSDLYSASFVVVINNGNGVYGTYYVDEK